MDAAKMLEIVTKIHSLTQKGVQISEITKLMINEQQQLMRTHMYANDEKDEIVQTNVCIYPLHCYTRSAHFSLGSLLLQHIFNLFISSSLFV